MNVGNVPYHAFPSIGYALSAGEGRMSLPVSPSSYIYSHFKNVSGTPAPEGTQGVNITRLKILDTLIEQLNRIKNQASPFFADSAASEEDRLSALIEHYQRQIRTSQTNSPYMAGIPAAGALLAISA